MAGRSIKHGTKLPLATNVRTVFSWCSALLRTGRLLADEALEVADDRGLRLGADDRLGDLAVLVDVQRRDGHHAVLGGRGRVLVDVQLDDLDLVAVLGGDGLQRRCDLAAWAAPGGPEVHQ